MLCPSRERGARRTHAAGVTCKNTPDETTKKPKPRAATVETMPCLLLADDTYTSAARSHVFHTMYWYNNSVRYSPVTPPWMC